MLRDGFACNYVLHNMSDSWREDTITDNANESNTDGSGIQTTAPPDLSGTSTMRRGVRNANKATPQPQGLQLEKNESRSFFMSEEQMKTPKSEQPPSIESLGPGVPSEGHLGDQKVAIDVDAATFQSQDYFASKPADNSEYGYLRAAMPALSSANSSPSLGETPATKSSTTSSPSGPSLNWKEFSAQPKASPPYHTHGNHRPTSVPNFHANPASRRREGPDYPKYPDQSFKALENQHYPVSYRSSSPHLLRTRSSHLSHTSSFSSTDNHATNDLPHLPSGAKTAGNTPAQSPGLFSPIHPAKKHWLSESSDGRSATPTLHPTHHKPPKE